MSQPWLKRKVNALELYTIDVIYGRRAGAGPALYGAFLQALSWLFSGIAQARLWLYRKRLLRDQPLGCLVVVVGNLTVGGTGKTPVVEKFARALRARGRKVAILSRGYKSKSVPFWRKVWWSLSHAAEPPPRVVSDGQQVLLDHDGERRVQREGRHRAHDATGQFLRRLGVGEAALACLEQRGHGVEV